MSGKADPSTSYSGVEGAARWYRYLPPHLDFTGRGSDVVLSARADEACHQVESIGISVEISSVSQGWFPIPRAFMSTSFRRLFVLWADY